MKKIYISCVFLFVFVFVCFASDITGNWRGTVKIPNRDDIELTYKLKSEGDKLTGTIVSQYGEMPLYDGKIKGDEFSFKVELGENVVDLNGKIYGDSIVIKSNFKGTDLQTTCRRVAQNN